MSYRLIIARLLATDASVALAACGGAAAAPPAVVSPAAAQIASPASTHCAERGYTLVIRKDAQGGESGCCQFPDGTECEEWAFFRNQCQPGQVRRAA
ncbi:MAG: DUF333 domain-containing protein [Actinobacteria bacterium]|nr:DUF333 domain-containing protein [Actinomycetota bacterium]